MSPVFSRYESCIGNSAFVDLSDCVCERSESVDFDKEILAVHQKACKVVRGKSLGSAPLTHPTNSPTYPSLPRSLHSTYPGALDVKPNLL